MIHKIKEVDQYMDFEHYYRRLVIGRIVRLQANEIIDELVRPLSYLLEEDLISREDVTCPLK